MKNHRKKQLKRVHLNVVINVIAAINIQRQAGVRDYAHSLNKCLT